MFDHMWLKYQSSNITLRAALLYRTPLTKKTNKNADQLTRSCKRFPHVGKIPMLKYNITSSVFMYRTLRKKEKQIKIQNYYFPNICRLYIKFNISFQSINCHHQGVSLLAS